MTKTSLVKPRPPNKRKSRVSGLRQNFLIGHSRATPYLFSLGSVLLVTIVLAIPVAYAVVSSAFRADTLGGPQQFVGFENYLILTRDPDFWAALNRSLIFVTGCVVVGITLAITFAFALLRAVGRLRFLRGLTLIPYVISSVATAVMFRTLFNSEFGLPNQFLELVGLPGQVWLGDPQLAMLIVILASVWGDLPLAILIILGGLQAIDNDFLDAALVDGAAEWQRTRYISLPLITPQLTLSMLWLSYGSLTTFGSIFALTGGGPGTATQTLPIEMFSAAFYRFDMGGGLAIATILLLLNALLTLMYVAVARRYLVD